MPEMGKPVNLRERSYQNVAMAPKNLAGRDPNQIRNNQREISDREKERLINRITGFKEKDPLVVDGANHNKMGKDEFLKLLTVQLQNQDPLNPMKQDKMAAELAQFSQLEQLSNLNKKFDGLTKNQGVQDKFYGASFLGKEVVTTGATLKYEGEGTDADILFTLEKPASKVLVRIFDNSNNMVGEMWKENIGRGNQTFSWDGIQLDNTEAGAGEYRTQLYAWDQFADPIDVKTKTTGTVESVFFENGETVLKVDGKKVFLRDVDSFHNGGNKVMTPPEKDLKPAINTGRRMDSPLNNTAPDMNAVNSAMTKLPVAQETQAKVNLNKIKSQNGINRYQEQLPTTGITNVYDE